VNKWRAQRRQPAPKRERTVVELTLAEADALRGAAGHGIEPTTPKELAALDRAISKCERANEIFRRNRRAR